MEYAIQKEKDGTIKLGFRNLNEEQAKAIMMAFAAEQTKAVEYKA